ncbi:hypothetical protein [Arthrobacter alpinus]|uniref:hypothetical protein n=1 Tax=Arthrobacter alpinus TaxID=656366 RepID=UPI0011149344|nr:hypothetical protein [Arthrobacter alpinus]
MGKIPPIYRLRAWFTEATADNETRNPRECRYGKASGAVDNCTEVVQPGAGVMYSGAVFCSEDHAILDQAEALI